MTDEGLERAGSVFSVMPKTEESLLERLGDRTLNRLNDDLCELLLMLEGPGPPSP